MDEMIKPSKALRKILEEIGKDELEAKCLPSEKTIEKEGLSDKMLTRAIWFIEQAHEDARWCDSYR